jgi:peptide deformylase
MSKDIKLTYFGNSILREKLPKVDSFDSTLLDIENSMKELMSIYGGVGIAANQCNVRKRIFLAIIDDKIVTFVNPSIVSYENSFLVDFEGCLSDPLDRLGLVRRHSKIFVSYQNVLGETTKLSLEGFNAVIFQHELDHINGVLFVDKLYDGKLFSNYEEAEIYYKSLNRGDKNE